MRGQALSRSSKRKQDRAALQLGRFLLLLLLADAERQLKPERAALADLGGHPDLPSHQLDQLARNRKAKAGATVFPGGGVVGLGEGFENPGMSFGRHADTGVDHLEADLHLIVVGRQQLRFRQHPAGFSELNGVRGKVDQYLPKVLGIAAQGVGNARVGMYLKEQPL